MRWRVVVVVVVCCLLVAALLACVAALSGEHAPEPAEGREDIRLGSRCTGDARRRWYKRDEVTTITAAALIIARQVAHAVTRPGEAAREALGRVVRRRGGDDAREVVATDLARLLD